MEYWKAIKPVFIFGMVVLVVWFVWLLCRNMPSAASWNISDHDFKIWVVLLLAYIAIFGGTK